MTDLSTEYRLSTYKDFGPLDGKEKIRLARSETDGTICVKKTLQPESLAIYTFLKEHPSPYFPRIRECVLQDTPPAAGQEAAQDMDAAAGQEPARVLVVIEEYIEGQSIDQLVAEQCFDETETIRAALEICQALMILHHADPPIIDRDIKAENVMLTKDGQVKLVDFDIARAYEEDKSHDTEALGTRNYAAPEQFGFSQTDGRTDIYALGVLINYMRTGKFPEQELVGGNLKPVVMTCINLDPADRYQSVDDLSQMLAALPSAPSGKTGKRGGGAADASQEDRPGGGQKKDRTWRSWLPPGFRTGTPWKIVVAVFMYFLMTAFTFSLEFTDEYGVPEPMGVQIVTKILIWLSLIVSVFFIWDYRGLRQKFPFFNPKDKILRFLSDVVVFLLLFFAAILISAIIMSWVV